jgi:hypothetical protein
MIVGLITLEIHIPGARSLKEKRMIIKSLKDRIKNTFNISIAEVDANNLWQKSIIGASCVANEKKFVNRTLNGVRDFVLKNYSVELIDYTIEIL